MQLDLDKLNDQRFRMSNRISHAMEDLRVLREKLAAIDKLREAVIAYRASKSKPSPAATPTV